MQRKIGQFHRLKVLELGTVSAVLDGEQWGRLLLDLKQCPSCLAPGDAISVFIYLGAQGKPTPTTERPAAELGQIGWLRVVDVNSLGAFVDWGLAKDLFVPFAEQQFPLTVGGNALVRVYLDNQGRLAGSTRIDSWLRDTAADLEAGQRVSLMIADKTELGFKAIVNHEYWGLLYNNDLYQRVRKGQVVDGFIQRIRDDGKIDLTVNQPGFSNAKISGISNRILAALRDNEGFLPLNDKSPPQEIYATFAVSKKVFKQALGALYKQRSIALESAGIRLLPDE